MIRILCIETSTEFCSVSLIEELKITGSKTLTINKSHSEHLLTLIDGLMQEKNISLTQLSSIAVSKGPGSYTGLRIGVSTAKGLCYSLNLPLISINALDLMAFQVIKNYNIGSKSLLCPMIDARRMEVYTKILDFNFLDVKNNCAKILDEHSFDYLLNDTKVYFFGNGSNKFKKIVKSSNALFIDNIFPNAINFNELAFNKYNKKDFEDLINFEPHYLKEYYFNKDG